MRKKLLVLTTVGMLALSGCGSDKSDAGKNQSQSTSEMISSEAVLEDTEATDSDAAALEEKDSETTGESVVEVLTATVAEEMEKIEQTSLEFENANWDLPQQEMNAKAYDWYILWDEELNSLWARLLQKLPEDKKESMVQLQNDWITRKDKNVIAAGIPAYGGSFLQ